MAKKKKPTPTQAPTPEPDTTAQQTQNDIIKIATEEFAQKGLAGARVDEIAERTQTSKRMIYYYFGGKDELYRAVLTKAYGDIRNRESQLQLGELEPVDAIRRLVELTFDYDETHASFIRLVMSENIHGAEHLAKLPGLRDISASVTRSLGDIVKRGTSQGVFKNPVDPVDLHLFISAFCFFRVSNQHTLKVIFGRDLLEAGARKRHKAMIVEAVLNLLGVSAKHRA
jgi:AcrR family transcriptional regulator